MSPFGLLLFVLSLAAVATVLLVAIEVFAAMNVRRCGLRMLLLWQAGALAAFGVGLSIIDAGPPHWAVTGALVAWAVVTWRTRKRHVQRAAMGA